MSKKPNFQDIHPLDEIKETEYTSKVKEAIDKEIAESIDDLLFETNEQIAIKSIYTDKDIDGLQHLDDKPGITPYTRGPYPTMYVDRPWTVRQYAGFSTAEESNAFYRRNLAGPKRACRLLLIWRHIAAMILITHEW